MDDKVDQAIAAADAAATQVAMIEIPVQIASTGRPAQIVIPKDMTDAELVELTGWMLTAVAGQLRELRARSPMGRIILPTGARPT